MRLTPRSRIVAALAATWGLLLGIAQRGGIVDDAFDWIAEWFHHHGADDLYWLTFQRVGIIGVLMIATMPFVAVIVALARSLAGRRFRATEVDRLARLRAEVARHPRFTTLVCALPGLIVTALGFLFRPGTGDGLHFATGAAISGAGALVATGLSALVGRGFLSLLVAPFSVSRPLQPEETSADGFYFSAVAVTPEATMAVGGLTAVSALAVATMATLPLGALETHSNAIGAYIAFVAGAVLLYRGASRIAIGLDGVMVTGTSRTRFFAYRDLDGAKASPSGEIHLQRGGRTVLRLQLHGKDLARRAAMVARIEAGIQRAGEESAAQRLGEAATASHLAQAARGETGYRHAAASREELWEVLEAPAADGTARTRAAAALAMGSHGEDRQRLRIAAEHSADPATRSALMRIVEGEAEEEEEPAARPVKVMTIPRS